MFGMALRRRAQTEAVLAALTHPSADGLRRAFIWTCVALYVFAFAYFAYQTRVLRPYSDLLDLLDFQFQHWGDGDPLKFLLEPHNYHRIAGLRLLLATDVGLFK